MDRSNDDIGLKLDGNLARFEDLMILLRRMVHAETNAGSSIPDMIQYHRLNSEWYDDSWCSDGWYDRTASSKDIGGRMIVHGRMGIGHNISQQQTEQKRHQLHNRRQDPRTTTTAKARN
eukprot:7539171-Pyramimonas_sp.AAC.1